MSAMQEPPLEQILQQRLEMSQIRLKLTGRSSSADVTDGFRSMKLSRFIYCWICFNSNEI